MQLHSNHIVVIDVFYNAILANLTAGENTRVYHRKSALYLLELEPVKFISFEIPT